MAQSRKRAAVPRSQLQNKKARGLDQHQSPRGHQGHGYPQGEDVPDDGLAEELFKDTMQMAKAMPNLLQELAEKSMYVKDFENKVRNDEKRLLTLLDDKVKERDEDMERFHAVFKGLLSEALTPPGQQVPDPPKSLPTGVFASAQNLCEKSSLLLQRSKQLCSEYERISKQTASLQRPADISEKWEDENDKARRIIKAGNVAIAAEIDVLLENNSRKAKKKGVYHELNENVESMLELGKEQDKEHEEDRVEGWGKVALKVSKGFNQLYKVIAEEAD